MPSHYAHYRFGTQVLATLPADVRRPIQRFRRLYDVGLHGPDLFFYHNFLAKDTVVALGLKYHHQTGREYFTRVCKRLRLEPTEAGIAYLYGVLAHYCLDSVCHPFVLEQTAGGMISHTELETEFDRYLLTLDGKEQPHTFDNSRHMKLTRGECVTVSEFYPPATPDNVLRSLKSMTWFTKNTAVPEGAKRGALKKGLSLTNPAVRGMLMPTRPNRACAALDEPMLALYEQAVALYPKLVEQLMAHMTYNAVLGDDFGKTFDGKKD
ncbi:MAG: zinc dependent phospholipase C family protein [Oscillospiraceae bacterium]|nr:zinc dependent phospholipase C family protein [Oscillospiraceae bacterium]